jgi:hypothetical protein
LNWGEEVWVQYAVYNLYGFSVSESVMGTILVTYPDSPLSLAENVARRGLTQIGLTWTSGVFNGGKSIIDYQIWYD